MKKLLWLIPAVASAATTLKIQTPQGVIDVPLERYVAGVLAGEASVFRSQEALKAMAVAARTYGVRERGRHRTEGFDLCSTTHCQRVEIGGITSRLEEAVRATAGEMLWYQGKPAFTVYAQDCGGQSDDAKSAWPDEAAPYLTRHDDPYCRRGGDSAWQWTGEADQIRRVLQGEGLKVPRTLDRITILTRSPGGRATMLLLAGNGESVRMSASSFRFAMGRAIGWNSLRSDLYEVRVLNGKFLFEGRGSGHGVGLCQRGAEQMGAAGKNYREILAFYYPGTVVGISGRGVPWQSLRAEGFTLLTTQPDRDRVVLDSAGRIARNFTERTHFPLSGSIEIRAYPDLDTFRNATGEPGWVAAHTEGSQIDLQPVAILKGKGLLDSTISHELIHVMLEAHARPGLPLWFREGLAGFLSGSRSVRSTAPPSDRDLQETDDQARAQRAYAEAIGSVGRLIDAYGEDTVLGWITRGLPAEVTKASASHATVKSK